MKQLLATVKGTSSIPNDSFLTSTDNTLITAAMAHHMVQHKAELETSAAYVIAVDIP
jgi:hypothetical protein